MARPFRAPSLLLLQTQAVGLGFVSSPLWGSNPDASSRLKPGYIRINDLVRNADQSPSCSISTGAWSCGIIAKISVAYGNQLAGVGGGELSLGEIAQSGNTVCGRRADSRVNLAGVTRGPTRQVALRRLRDSRHAVCSPVRRNSIGGESGRADGSGGSEVHASTEVGGLQRAPAVAPDQRFGEGPAGGTREKRC